MATLKDFLGFVINPPPGDPTLTANSDLLPKTAVVSSPAGSGQVPVADGVGGYTWQTPAAAPATVAARAYRNGALAATVSVWQKIPLDTLNYDTAGNLFQAANNRFVAPVTGTYQVVGQLMWGISATAATVNAIAGIYKNGGVYTAPNSWPTIANVVASVVVDFVPLNAGDYVELWGWINQASANVNPASSNTFMAVALVN